MNPPPNVPPAWTAIFARASSMPARVADAQRAGLIEAAIAKVKARERE